jgi:SAM-dependent methyltransferase
MSAPVCLCRASRWARQFLYEEPPKGETRFPHLKSYRREILRCEACGHFVSLHQMDLSGLYGGAYVDATYGANGLRASFDRISALPPESSDNVGRVRRIQQVVGSRGTVLDVGSGVCVFLHRMKEAGWTGTALDPDPRAVEHARATVGVNAVCGDFMTVEGLGRFDLVTFNKVLEHVPDPVAMLTRAQRHVNSKGCVYVEVPDGAAAASDGPGREEFFIEHHHVFSTRSAERLADAAGFGVRQVESLREPSGKYTLRLFLEPRHA